MTAEQIDASANLVRAYNAKNGLAHLGLWLFLTVLALLVFRCNGVALWEPTCPPAKASP